MGDTLSKAALGFLGIFVTMGIVVGLSVLWLLRLWCDDDTPFD